MVNVSEPADALSWVAVPVMTLLPWSRLIVASAVVSLSPAGE